MSGRSLIGRLPLFWKLLLPVVVLVLVIGPSAAYLVVRDAASREEASLDQELLGQFLDVQTRLRDQELRIAEAARLAGNLRGMAEAVLTKDAAAVADLLAGVLAISPDVATVQVLDADRALLGAAGRDGPGSDGAAQAAGPVITGDSELVTQVVVDGGDHWLAVAVPVCAGTVACESVGAAVSAIRLRDAVAATQAASRFPGLRVNAVVEPTSGRPAGPPVTAEHERRVQPEKLELSVDGEEMSQLAGPLWIGGSDVGSVLVQIPSASSAAVARGTADRLALVFVVAMMVVVGVAALLARSILRQVRELLATARRLGSGDLAARSALVTDDEIGELARALNAMADTVENSHDLLEDRVRERTKEVEHLLRERTEFFASLSHELRTPIAIVLTQARLRRPGARGPHAEAWSTVAVTSEQLLATVNAILDLARAGSGRLEVSLGDVDLGALLSEVVHGVVAHAAVGGVEVTLELDDPPLRVRADDELLRQAVFNLLDNGIKYTPPGGRVTVRGSNTDDGWIVVTVTDTGIGVPEGTGDRIFAPFHRVPGARTQRGEPSSGLGLALARTLVEAQGGTLSYSSLEGGGTTFVVALCRTADDNREVETSRVREARPAVGDRTPPRSSTSTSWSSTPLPSRTGGDREQEAEASRDNGDRGSP